jgi:hypothetical protein
MSGPEFISRLHLTILEVEGLVFNILLFCRFVLSEIKSIMRHYRPRRGAGGRVTG